MDAIWAFGLRRSDQYLREKTMTDFPLEAETLQQVRTTLVSHYRPDLIQTVL